MNFRAIDDDHLFEQALLQARHGLDEGGVPIGAALAVDDELRSVGRNRRVQEGSTIRHAEMDCLESAGRLTLAEYARATLATTHSPCLMCAGAMVHFGVGRIVIGADVDFARTRPFLDWAGAHYLVRGDAEPLLLLERFISEHPDVWNEDIGSASE